MKLSIILTVYNKEPYLKRALDAILNQKGLSNGEYEVLAVNDGSTDGSAAIIDEYAKRDSRLRVLTQRNQGLSMARNNGVQEANGDYVWFVDADDIISSKAVSLICGAMASQPDIIPIYAQTEGDERIRNCVPRTAKTGKDILLSGRWQACGVFNVFRRGFLRENNLSFFPGIFHEDSEFTPRVLFLAKKVLVVPEVLYIVIHEPNSITQVPRPKRAFDCLIVAERLKSFIDSQVNTDPVVARSFNSYISGVINGALRVIIQNSDKDQELFNKALYNEPLLLHVFFETGVIRYRIEGLLFKLFPERYTRIFSLMKILQKQY